MSDFQIDLQRITVPDATTGGGMVLAVQRITLPRTPARVATRGAATQGAGANSLATMVFLHESLGCIDTWREFPAFLAEAVGLDAIVYDRLGYGLSAPMPDTPRTPRYLHTEAERLFALLDALGIGEVVLFGHSDGGSIALLAAAMQPARVRAVITEGAHVFVEEETLEGVRIARALMTKTDLPVRLARYHGDKVARLTSAWIDTWLSPAFRDWNIEADLRNARCPALIIQGEDDEYGTPAQVDAIVEAWSGKAEPLLLAGARHTPHREANKAVMTATTAFLSGVLA
jgi:pimeloyl-ACP methyl ester carboxylesterase